MNFGDFGLQTRTPASRGPVLAPYLMGGKGGRGGGGHPEDEETVAEPQRLAPGGPGEPGAQVNLPVLSGRACSCLQHPGQKRGESHLQWRRRPSTRLQEPRTGGAAEPGVPSRRGRKCTHADASPSLASLRAPRSPAAQTQQGARGLGGGLEGGRTGTPGSWASPRAAQPVPGLRQTADEDVVAGTVTVSETWPCLQRCPPGQGWCLGEAAPPVRSPPRGACPSPPPAPGSSRAAKLRDLVPRRTPLLPRGVCPSLAQGGQLHSPSAGQGPAPRLSLQSEGRGPFAGGDRELSVHPAASEWKLPTGVAPPDDSSPRDLSSSLWARSMSCKRRERP